MKTEQTAIDWLVDQLYPSISLQSKYIEELKQRAKQKETAISYANTQRVGNEWYADKIAKNKVALIKMEQPFSVKEYAD